MSRHEREVVPVSRHEREVVPVSRHERETVTTSHYDDFALRRPSISITFHYDETFLTRSPLHRPDLRTSRADQETGGHSENFLGGLVCTGNLAFRLQ